jgi:hypothetical protein
MSTIKNTIMKHGANKVRALIPLRPLHTYLGLISVTTSSDPKLPVLCEVDESRYEVADDYKITWKPIKEYAPVREAKMHTANGFSSETFYQTDFDSLVKRGSIKVYVEA